uniref:VWFA domain-containing protein n=1 Tax=Globodera pallida TaxID=36090 RepID=A0A183BKC7_GLOPA
MNGTFLTLPAFDPNTYPDSLREWTECGGIDRAALVCDPDTLLDPGPNGTPGILLLDAASRHIQANTECICDIAAESEGNAFGLCQQNPPMGFVVTVAVLGKMEVTDDQRRRYRNGAHLPAIFANELRNRLQRGQCADDVLIVLAVNDSSVGGTKSTKLDAEFLLNVSQTAQKMFSRGENTGGLLYMLGEYGSQLGAPPFAVEEQALRERDGWWDTNFWPMFPQALRQSELRWFWLLFVLFLLLILLLLGVFIATRLLRNKKRNSAGYRRGQPTNKKGGK